MNPYIYQYLNLNKSCFQKQGRAKPSISEGSSVARRSSHGLLSAAEQELYCFTPAIAAACCLPCKWIATNAELALNQMLRSQCVAYYKFCLSAIWLCLFVLAVAIDDCHCRLVAFAIDATCRPGHSLDSF